MASIENLESIPIRILFFAQAREQAKTGSSTVQFSSQKLKPRDILNYILEKFPNLKPLEQCIILARNQTYLDIDSEEEVTLSSGDEVAVIPPISAGLWSDKNNNKSEIANTMDIIKLTHDVIDVNELMEAVSSPTCGAVSIFVGTTRDNFENKKVVRLEYEAYEPMAVTEIKKICLQLREKWHLEHIGVIHRLGLVPVKEASIVVAISSEHRRESLEAVHFAIDALKAAVPIWKKEVYAPEDEDESLNSLQEVDSAWKANQECFWNKDKNGNGNIPDPNITET